VLPADVAGDPEVRGRFEREARAIAALDHWPAVLLLAAAGLSSSFCTRQFNSSAT
jgi:hypothetical protein